MVTQNRSTAVMQRRAEPHHSLDDYPTPPWATRALCEWLNGQPDPQAPGSRIWTHSLTCREPAANRGHMARPLREFFKVVEASDVHDYGAGFAVRDFLFPEPLLPVDWTITNPPFRLAEQFIERALDTSERGVAMFVRSAFVEGIGRYERLFSRRRPSHVLQFAERVVLHKGRLAPEGSTATAYCWIVWMCDRPTIGTRFDWLAPGRKRLERDGDYPAEVTA